ncbi:MAG: hypothetical protein ABI782_05665, partial [Anaerolineaceae bacterium]
MSDDASVPGVAGTRPIAAYRPETVEELATLLRVRDGGTLLPMGGRTRLELGNAPAGSFAVVDLTAAFGGEIHHEAADLTVVVPASATVAE